MNKSDSMHCLEARDLGRWGLYISALLLLPFGWRVACVCPKRK